MDIRSISFLDLAVSITIWISHHAPNDYLCPLKNSIALNILYMFNKRIKIKELLTREPSGQEVTVMGWVRTFRNNQFIALNDGSTNNNLQVVAALGKFDEELLKRITTSAALKVTGNIVASLGKGQKMDLNASAIEILGDSDAEKYPLQPKKHSLEFLREIAHLRFRTSTFGSVFRVRHALRLSCGNCFSSSANLCARNSRSSRLLSIM